MTQALGIASIVLAICALAGTLYALAFAIAGVFSAPPASEEQQAPPPGERSARATRFLALIPAHNEGAGLTSTVESVLRQDYPHVRCIVVADNCTDDTAEAAAAAGAHTVLIRSDPDKRGKGYALTWAFDRMRDAPWDAVCVIDADSVIAPGFFSALNRSFRQGHLAAQARYDFLPSTDTKNWMQQFSAVSKAGENSFVYRPREKLRLSHLLMGNGFFLSRAALERVPWNAHSIVEDAEQTLALWKQGIAVHYQERARLWSRQAASVRDVHPQRVRWASGVWQLFRRAIPDLLATAWRQRGWRPLEQAFMLLTTSRLVLIYLLVLAIALSFAAPSFLPITGSLVIVTVILQAIYLVLMFRFACDRPVPLKGLAFLPFYVSVILFAQVFALSGLHRRRWQRTAR